MIENRVKKPALIVCLPNRGTVTIETVQALSRTDGFPSTLRAIARKPVVEARAMLAAHALAAAKLLGSEYRPFVVWADADSWWRRGTIAKAISTLQEHPEIGMLVGWFCARKAKAAPAVRYLDGTWPRPGINCEWGDLVDVERAGLHFAVHRVRLLEDFPDPFTPEPDEGEDFAFCRKLRERGVKIVCDTGLPVAHIGDDGTAYLPGYDAMEVVGEELRYREQEQIRVYA